MFLMVKLLDLGVGHRSRDKARLSRLKGTSDVYRMRCSIIVIGLSKKDVTTDIVATPAWSLAQLGSVRWIRNRWRAKSSWPCRKLYESSLRKYRGRCS